MALFLGEQAASGNTSPLCAAPGVVTVAPMEEVLALLSRLPHPSLQRGALPTTEPGSCWAARLTLLPLASGPRVPGAKRRPRA